ncbi:nitrile hydratase subunit beta [Shimia biformata]|uniref:nitrile hydratase subunit beta n=1 Tax=Shimia biformata TaxID=1294299 RepID=UPI00194E382E|nr:nitrile hydratase subunit beta [Shimia biformata]
MSRVHDMGGRFGDGPIDPAPEPVFKQDWHARALALTLAAGAMGKWNIDTSRHARVCLSPADYARFSYYEKWLAGLADLLVATGVVTEDELQSGSGAVSALSEKKLPADRVAEVLARGGPSTRPSNVAPVFKPGDWVRTRKPARNICVDGGHTRLPAYLAGVEGKVVLYHGTHVLPDMAAHGLGESPEPLYTVAFDATEVWGAAERDGDEVLADLWQSYLEPA